MQSHEAMRRELRPHGGTQTGFDLTICSAQRNVAPAGRGKRGNGASDGRRDSITAAGMGLSGTSIIDGVNDAIGRADIAARSSRR
jgi:hypothetical protein